MAYYHQLCVFNAHTGIFYTHKALTNHLFLDVLDQEWGRTQVVHRAGEETLDLLLMQVHGDDVRQPCGAQR